MNQKNFPTCNHPENHNSKLCVPMAAVDEFDSFGEMLLHSLRQNGDAIAQIDSVTGNIETYSDLLTKCVRIAVNIERIGLKQGDAISFCTMNNLECYPTAIGCFIAGATFSAMDPMLSLSETEHMIELVEPKYIFCDAAGVQLTETAIRSTKSKAEIIFYGESTKYRCFSELLQCVDNETGYQAKKANVLDTAAIYFSSGTTGLPKGIALSHKCLLNLCKSSSIKIRAYITTRMCWISATILFGPACYNCYSWVMSPDYDTKDILQIVSKYQVECLITAPFHAHQLTKFYKDTSAYDVSSLKIYVIIGGLISKQQILALRQFFPDSFIFTSYGLTETTGGFLSFTFEDIEKIMSKPGSVGRVVNGNCVKIVDVDTEQELGPNKHGELRVKSVQIMNEYHKNPAATAAAFDKDGYFCTGDILYYDEDGYFYFVDRIKDVMKFRSFYVMPMELEKILLTHPDVLEAVIISIPHEEDMDHPMALVKLAEGAQVTEEQIRSFVDDQVVDYKRLRGGVKIVDNIPKTASCKQRRRHIRNMVIKGKL